MSVLSVYLYLSLRSGSAVQRSARGVRLLLAESPRGSYHTMLYRIMLLHIILFMIFRDIYLFDMVVPC